MHQLIERQLARLRRIPAHFLSSAETGNENLSATALYARALNEARGRKLDEAAETYRLALTLDADYKNALMPKVAPAYVQLETVRACNAACIMCPLETSPIQHRVMSDALFDRVATQIAAMRPRPNVAMHGLGEPLMDKKIHQRVRRLRDLGIPWVHLVSNASLMTEEKARQLIDAGINDISFSIESVDAKTFERIRVGISLESVIAGITNFLQVRDRGDANIPVHILFTYSEWNRHQYPEFRAFWQKRLRPERGDAIMVIPIHSFGQFALYNDANFGPCYQVFTDMHVRADGTVSLCCIDVNAECKIGDAKAATLLDIYNNPQIREDRHKHLTGQRHAIELCAKCDQPECSARVMTDTISAPAPMLDRNDKFFIAPPS